MTVAKDQKHTTSNPCGVCVGYESAKRHSAERCWGFTSDDGKYVYCSRDDHAGSLQKDAATDAYRHYMVGKCDCGTNHTGSFTAPAQTAPNNAQRPSTRKAPLGDPVAVYEYGSGTDSFIVMKFKPKDFRQSKTVDGKRVTPWSMKGVTTSLFHQKEVENAELSKRVHVTEGEKDSLSLEAKGEIATTNPMGAGKWRDHFNPAFKGHTVIIHEDNDAAGREHVQQVAAGISPVAASVKIVRFPDERKGYDISNFLEAGGTREQLNALIENAPEWVPTPGLEDDGAVSAEWGEMQSLPAATPPVPTLPPDLLPETLRPWIVAAAKRMPVPIEYIAMGVFSALGSVIGRQCGIKPERFNDFTVLCNLWGAVVGGPGTKKSGAVSTAIRHITRLGAEAAEVHEEGSAAREAKQVMLKAEESKLAGDIKAALSSPDSSKADRLELDLIDLIKKKEKEGATARRFTVNDATTESIGVILNANPNGLMSVHDELAGFLATLEKSGREGDREFYLAAWSSKDNHDVDRVGRGHLRIVALTLTVFGGIQPGKLERYVNDAIGGGAGADGLIQRVQLLVWPAPDAFPTWEPADEPEDEEAKNRAWEVFKRLSEIQMPGNDPDDPTQIPVVNFTAEAQELHTFWRTGLDLRMLETMADTPAFESHIQKYLSLVPALALIYYLADLPAGEAIIAVPIEALMLALRLADFLEAHARKVYAPELNPGMTNAFALSKRIRSGDVKDGDSVRDIYAHNWKDLTDTASTLAAVKILEERGWVRIDREETGGRPTTKISLHPELRKGKSNG